MAVYTNVRSSGTVLPIQTSITQRFPGDYELGRVLWLEAEYNHHLNRSWECYRWRLYDGDFNVLQDTGRKYDKKIWVQFFGLEITKHLNHYYVNLQIEDELGCVLDHTWEFKRYSPEINKPTAVSNFTATCDRQTQTVLLTCETRTPNNGSSENGEEYSFYRREMQVIQKNCPMIPVEITEDSEGVLHSNIRLEEDEIGMWQYDSNNSDLYLYYESARNDSDPLEVREVDPALVYYGAWEPVKLLQRIKKNEVYKFRDFNVENNKVYQYVVFPKETPIISGQNAAQQLFANEQGTIWYDTYADSAALDHVTNQGVVLEGTNLYGAETGAPVTTCWNWWSIVDLVPEDNVLETPVLKQTYRADYKNVWLFKYSVETGSQMQTITRNEIQTLGQFSKVGYGQQNYVSGSVNALLGSEIIPETKLKYVERTPEDRVKLQGSNERIEMLEAWRKLVNSTHPKLLKDIKGQAWIVQIFSSSNTPQNFYYNQPDTISFEWKQIQDTDGIVIYDNYEEQQDVIRQRYGISQGKPLYGKGGGRVGGYGPYKITYALPAGYYLIGPSTIKAQGVATLTLKKPAAVSAFPQAISVNGDSNRTSGSSGVRWTYDSSTGTITLQAPETDIKVVVQQ